MWDRRIISCLCKIKIIINYIAIVNISNPSRTAASIINRYVPIFYIYLSFYVFQSRNYLFHFIDLTVLSRAEWIETFVTLSF